MSANFVTGTRCGDLVPTTCRAAFEIPFASPEAPGVVRKADSTTSCYPQEFRNCVDRTLRRAPFTTSAAATRWRARVIVGR